MVYRLIAVQIIEYIICYSSQEHNIGIHLAKNFLTVRFPHPYHPSDLISHMCRMYIL